MTLGKSLSFQFINFLIMYNDGDVSVEEPLIFEHKARHEGVDWKASTESIPPAYQREVKTRRSLNLYAIILFPWALFILLGCWEWIQYQNHEQNCIMAAQLTYS